MESNMIEIDKYFLSDIRCLGEKDLKIYFGSAILTIRDIVHLIPCQSLKVRTLKMLLTFFRQYRKDSDIWRNSKKKLPDIMEQILTILMDIAKIAYCRLDDLIKIEIDDLINYLIIEENSFYFLLIIFVYNTVFDLRLLGLKVD